MTPRPRQNMPDDVRRSLDERDLAEAHDTRPFYQRADYLAWIGRVKRPETRRKRIEQMLDELEEGGVYMKMSHPPSVRPRQAHGHAAGPPGESRKPMSSEEDTSRGGAWDQHLYKILTAAAAGLLAVGTIAYRWLEDWSWVDSFYFSAVAVTTVGFGDFTPSTDPAKLFTVAYIFAGVAIVTAYLNARLRRRGERHADRA